MNSSENPRGFTLIDLLCALALAAIVTVVALPAFDGLATNYGLAAAADELAAELNAARVMAVSRGSTFTVTFDTASNSYQVIEVSDPNNPTRIRRTLPAGLRIARGPLTPIAFTSRGTARGGSIVLTSDSGNRIIVQVENSGRTRVHEMDSYYDGAPAYGY